ncbi:hypothetical protein GF369_01380, partial [Candidatus Peregrinibacteria bacterium]|nr:hypothetical protein [Candidatus Peregrinibacteria bacterium]
MILDFDFAVILKHLMVIFLSFTASFTLAVILTRPFLALLKKAKIHKQIREIASTGEKASLY